jgi:hypothetical protein
VADNRELFTSRIHDAMVAAEGDSEKRPLERVRWETEPVCLPPREDLEEASLLASIAAAAASGRKASKNASKAALMLTYLRRWQRPIPITCLHLNDDAAILHLPGETFIEYQLHAQQARPDAFVATAGYGDQGTGYITVAGSADQGGYEPVDAFVSERSEPIMRAAIDKVLQPV